MALKNIKNHTCAAVTRNGGILKTDQIELVGATSNPSDSDLADSRVAYNSTDNIFYGRANSLWFPLGGVQKIKSVTTTTTLTTSESGQVIKCASAGDTLALTLPSAATSGIVYHIVQDSSNASKGDLYIYPEGVLTNNSQWIGGVTGTFISLNVRGECLTIVSDGGTAWLAIARYG